MEVWAYTPGRARTFCDLIDRRQRRERAHSLHTAAFASRGDHKEIKRAVNRDLNE